MSQLAAPLKWIAEHRKRLVPLVMGGGVLVVGSILSPHMPRDTDVEFALGEGAREVRELHVDYLRVTDGEVMKSVVFRYGDEGAPRRVPHHVRLPEGRYDVSIETQRVAGVATQVHRRLDVPSAGVVMLRN